MARAWPMLASTKLRPVCGDYGCDWLHVFGLARPITWPDTRETKSLDVEGRTNASRVRARVVGRGQPNISPQWLGCMSTRTKRVGIAAVKAWPVAACFASTSQTIRGPNELALQL